MRLTENPGWADLPPEHVRHMTDPPPPLPEDVAAVARWLAHRAAAATGTPWHTGATARTECGAVFNIVITNGRRVMHKNCGGHRVYYETDLWPLIPASMSVSHEGAEASEHTLREWAARNADMRRRARSENPNWDVTAGHHTPDDVAASIVRSYRTHATPGGWADRDRF